MSERCSAGSTTGGSSSHRMTRVLIILGEMSLPFRHIWGVVGAPWSADDSCRSGSISTARLPRRPVSRSWTDERAMYHSFPERITICG